MDTLKNLLSSINALAVLGFAALIAAVVLTFAGAPLVLLLLLYCVGVMFSIVWWLMTRDSR